MYSLYLGSVLPLLHSPSRSFHYARVHVLHFVCYSILPCISVILCFTPSWCITTCFLSFSQFVASSGIFAIRMIPVPTRLTSSAYLLLFSLRMNNFCEKRAAGCYSGPLDKM